MDVLLMAVQYVGAVGGVGALDQSPNVLSFPASKYDNMRNSFGSE